MEKIENVDVRELAQTYGTPLYVYSKNRILKNYHALREAFGSRYQPLRIHFAVKSNLNLSILKLLQAEGAGADCASPGELEHAVRAGFEPGKIFYTGNYESEEDLRAALNKKVLLNLDSEGAFDRAMKIGRPEVVSFRVNPGIGKGGFEQIITGGNESKFGIPFESAQALYAKAKAAGIRRLGIHMHTGSNILEPADFEQIVTKLMEIAGGVFGPLGIQPEFIDIGGGLGIPYTDEEKPLDLEQTAERVTRAFSSQLKKLNLGQPILMIEPGRYIVADAGYLVAKVTGIKSSYRDFVGLDAGMQTLLRPALYGAFHRVEVVGASGRPRRKVSLCGQICESTDVFYKDFEMPEAREGDLVVFRDAGAYGYAMASSYNGRPRPAEVWVDGDRHALIRRRETADDLFHLFP